MVNQLPHEPTNEILQRLIYLFIYTKQFEWERYLNMILRADLINRSTEVWMLSGYLSIAVEARGITRRSKLWMQSVLHNISAEVANTTRSSEL